MIWEPEKPRAISLVMTGLVLVAALGILSALPLGWTYEDTEGGRNFLNSNPTSSHDWLIAHVHYGRSVPASELPAVWGPLGALTVLGLLFVASHGRGWRRRLGLPLVLGSLGVPTALFMWTSPTYPEPGYLLAMGACFLLFASTALALHFEAEA